MAAVSIVTPAFKAETTIHRAVQSVLAQSLGDWEMIIVADDLADYEAILGRAGIKDARLRFAATGNMGAGSPGARNIGLDMARYDISAVLDADDLLAPEKLERCVAAINQTGLVSTGLQVVDAALAPLRLVGVGADRVLPPGDYKFTNISMDSMVVYDRRKADPRFDPELPCLTDIDFVLRIFQTIPACFHIGAPLHTYVKQPGSISSSDGVTSKYVKMKQRLMQLLPQGEYPLADKTGIDGLMRFYKASLAAEQAFDAARAAEPGLVFETHLERFLTKA